MRFLLNIGVGTHKFGLNNCSGGMSAYGGHTGCVAKRLLLAHSGHWAGLNGMSASR